MKTIFLIGYYGFDNLGDDLLLKSIQENLPKFLNDFQVYVLLKKNINLRKNFFVVLRSDIKKILASFKDCEAVVFGGGGLLQDSTSLRSLIYYLTFILLGKLFKKKIILLAQSIGPLNKFISKNLVKNFLKNIDLITVREELSLSLLKYLSLNKNIFKTEDLVFALNVKDKKKLVLTETAKPFIVVCPRPAKEKKYQKYLKKIIFNLQSLIFNADNLTFVFIAFAPEDISICEDLSAQLKNKLIVEAYNNLENIFSYFNNCEFVIGERLHSIILASLFYKPFLAIGYDPKVTGVVYSLNQQEFIFFANETKKELKEKINNLINQKEIISSNLMEIINGKKFKALQNFKLLQEVLEKNNNE